MSTCCTPKKVTYYLVTCPGSRTAVTHSTCHIAESADTSMQAYEHIGYMPDTRKHGRQAGGSGPRPLVLEEEVLGLDGGAGVDAKLDVAGTHPAGGPAHAAAGNQPAGRGAEAGARGVGGKALASAVLPCRLHLLVSRRHARLPRIHIASMLLRPMQACSMASCDSGLQTPLPPTSALNTRTPV